MTVAMNAVEFHQPVFVGDVVSFWTLPLRVGTTSITVHVSVEAERGGQEVRLTEAEVTFVAVDLPPPIGDRFPGVVRHRARAEGGAGMKATPALGSAARPTAVLQVPSRRSPAPALIIR